MALKSIPSSTRRAGFVAGILLVAVSSASAQYRSWVVHPTAQAEGSADAGVPVPPVRTMDDLCRLTPEQLQALYCQGTPAPVLAGQVKGRALMRPGTGPAVLISRGSRILWQGKIFRPGGNTAINRFFGLPVIQGKVHYGPSWYDQGNALILDYAGTSRLYRDVRDEMRVVAPGLILGLMYDRTQPHAGPTRYFALEYR